MATKKAVEQEKAAKARAEAAPAASTAPKGKSGRKPVDPHETKAAKFIRLGKHRVLRALKAIRVVGNLAGASYEYTPAQVAKISSDLETELKIALKRFQPREPGAEKPAETYEL